MSVIWKYRLDAVRRVAIDMPAGARLVSVQTQDGAGCVWALVDPNAPLVKRIVEVAGTGWDLPNDLGEYVGTFQTGPFVWHLFDIGERPQ